MERSRQGSPGRLGPSGPVDRQLLDALDEGILVAKEGRVVWANAALARMAGLAPSELRGARVSELLADADGRPVAALSPAAARLRDAGGRLRPVSVRGVDAETAIVVDRARERRLEQEIWQLSGALPTGGDPVVDETLGMIEHEVGTAATVIRGFLRLLLEGRGGALRPEQRSFLLEARRAAERVHELVADLQDLAASRSEGGLRVAPKRERLNPVVELAARAAGPALADRELGLDLELELRDDRLLIDTRRIEQVLANLLSNAARFAPRRTRVRVATHLVEDSGGEMAAVSVIDEGAGVDLGESEAIFEPFARGREPATGHGTRGAGLGLAICRAIAAAHGGRVEAVPSLGYGLFRLLLPIERQGE